MTPFVLPGRRGTSRGAPGLRLFGVVSLAAPGRLAVDGAAASARERLHTPPLGTPAAEVVRVRDLGAVAAEARFAEEPLTDDLVRGHRAVVEAVFAERAVLPAPPGALFRSRAALTAWMELHAASLADGLRFVEDRMEARVTAQTAPGEARGDAVALAADAFAAIRREAAALLVLRPDVGAPDGTHPAALTLAGRELDGRELDGREVDGRGLVARGDERPGSLSGMEVDGAAAPADAQAAFLVDRARWPAFFDAVAREGRRWPALRLTCAGPWPPYSFVRLDFNG